MAEAWCLLGILATVACIDRVIASNDSSDDNSDESSELGLRRRPVWRVTAVEDFPFLRKKTASSATQLDEYEGFIPDVLKQIGIQLHQTYSFYLTPDGSYGKPIPGTRRYTGMLGEVLDLRADLAAAPIAVTGLRKQILDYTEPIFSVRVVILILKPSKGVHMSVMDLINRKDITIGSIKDATIMQLLQNSSHEHFNQIARDLIAYPDRTTDTAAEGVIRLRKEGGKFAFMTDSCSGLYWVNQEPCDLVRVETYLPQSEQAFVIGKHSPIKARLDMAITHLRETGTLVKLRLEWWKDHCSSGTRHPWSVLFVLPLSTLVLGVKTYSEFY